MTAKVVLLSLIKTYSTLSSRDLIVSKFICIMFWMATPISTKFLASIEVFFCEFSMLFLVHEAKSKRP